MKLRLRSEVLQEKLQENIELKSELQREKEISEANALEALKAKDKALKAEERIAFLEGIIANAGLSIV